MKVSRAVIGVDAGLVAKAIAKESDRPAIIMVHAAIHREDQRFTLFIQFAFQCAELKKGCAFRIAVKQTDIVRGHGKGTDRIGIA